MRCKYGEVCILYMGYAPDFLPQMQTSSYSDRPVPTAKQMRPANQEGEIRWK